MLALNTRNGISAGLAGRMSTSMFGSVNSPIPDTTETVAVALVDVAVAFVVVFLAVVLVVLAVVLAVDLVVAPERPADAPSDPDGAWKDCADFFVVVRPPWVPPVVAGLPAVDVGLAGGDRWSWTQVELDAVELDAVEVDAVELDDVGFDAVVVGVMVAGWLHPMAASGAGSKRLGPHGGARAHQQHHRDQDGQPMTSAILRRRCVGTHAGKPSCGSCGR